jgi:hypothetical protein
LKIGSFIPLYQYFASDDIFYTKGVCYPSQVILSGSDVSQADYNFLIDANPSRYSDLAFENRLEDNLT